MPKRSYISGISDKLREGDDYFCSHRKGEVQVGYRRSSDPEIKLLVFKKFTHRSIVIKNSRRLSLPSKKDGDDKKVTITKSRTFLRHIPVNPEFCDYIFHIPSASVKFMMYALGFIVDYESNQFKYNGLTYEKYNRYCQQLNPGETSSKDISKRTLYNAIRDLEKYHIITNVTRGTYMINPLVACMGDSSRLSTMIKIYAQLLLDDNKDVEIWITPLQF